MAEHGNGHAHGHGDGHVDHAHHVVPVKTYLIVFSWLMVLLVITLVAAAFDLGAWNVVLAVTIAVVKAALVMWFFMHLGYSTKLVRFMGFAALFWVVILFTITMSDYVARGWFKI
jgi:cytochrome c oxidase subunit 4